MDASRARYGVVVRGWRGLGNGPVSVLLAPTGMHRDAVTGEEVPLWAVLILHAGRRPSVSSATFGPRNVWEEQQ